MGRSWNNEKRKNITMSARTGKSMTASPSVTYTERGTTRTGSRRSVPSTSKGVSTTYKYSSTAPSRSRTVTRSMTASAYSRTASKSGRSEFKTYVPSHSKSGSQVFTASAGVRTATGNTSSWGPVSQNRTATGLSGPSFMSYDVESGRPSVMYVQEPVEEKKSNSCCIWTCVIGSVVVIALFLVVFYWDNMFGTKAVRVEKQDQSKVIEQQQHQSKVKQGPRWNDRGTLINGKWFGGHSRFKNPPKPRKWTDQSSSKDFDVVML